MNDIEITEKSLEEFESEGTNQINISHKTLSAILRGTKASSYTSANPWTEEDVDKYATHDLTKDYREAVKSCRFFYRRDPIASSVVNKLVDIGISDLVLIQGDTSDTDYRLYESVLPELQDFAEDCALEFLISGLVIPEVEYDTVTKRELTKRNIKYKSSASLPNSMWLRDPETVVINSPLIGSKDSYYVELPDELVFFVMHEGRYPDGTEDKELYKQIAKQYPKFVREIREKNVKSILLDNPTVIRRRSLTDSPYPTPYLYPAIEPLRHKRNLRRMDYSIAARVISAIQHIKVGDKDFPLTEEDDVQLETLRQQMRWRDTYSKDIDRIFQLFTNHTVQISWVFPDTNALLSEEKYKSINQDIIYALGIPRILITGETERSQSSDAGAALISPTKTLERMREKIRRVLQDIIFDIQDKNNLSSSPIIEFKSMRLTSFDKLLESLKFLYESGNISRTTIDKELGYDFEKELDIRIDEQSALDESGIPEFAPQPHSNDPSKNTSDVADTQNTDEEDEDTDNGE